MSKKIKIKINLFFCVKITLPDWPMYKRNRKFQINKMKELRCFLKNSKFN